MAYLERVQAGVENFLFFPRFSLFWRTFLWLATLLVGTLIISLKIFEVFETEPRNIQIVNRIDGLTKLSQAALLYKSPEAKELFILEAKNKEGIAIVPRKEEDVLDNGEISLLTKYGQKILKSKLDPEMSVFSAVNGVSGAWVAISVRDENYWIYFDPEWFGVNKNKYFFIYLIIFIGYLFLTTALVSYFINKPLKQLSFAASRVRTGDFSSSYLDESAVTSEVREVNMDFNRMTQKIAEIEQDRAVMLAGISHDLRTPLTRLRLEVELSVSDLDARSHMIADIIQLDRTIDKFLDYARPNNIKLKPILLKGIINLCLYAVKDDSELKIVSQVDDGICVLADNVELNRVISNLIENSRRYGKTSGKNMAHILITAKVRGNWVLLRIRDYGSGVSAEVLPNLTKPFFRGDTARTAAIGAGLGLSIADKVVQRMGGFFSVVNAASGGFEARIQLRRDTSAPPSFKL